MADPPPFCPMQGRQQAARTILKASRGHGHPMALSDITPVIIVRNAEKTIETTLGSLEAFPRVVLYDNGSTDCTLDLAARFPNVRVERGDFFGFGPTKNYAASLAQTDWVFSLDADESASPALLANLDRIDLSNPARAYAMHRHNYFLGRRIRHAGWGDDWIVRLYHRRRHAYNDAMVHESVALGPGGRVERLDGPLVHDAVLDLGQFLVKVDRYSELHRMSTRDVLPAGLILLRAAWAFFRTYILQLGVLDGWRGLVIAWSNADGAFYKHMKPYADRSVDHERKKSSHGR